jgi:hypothetical protein
MYVHFKYNFSYSAGRGGEIELHGIAGSSEPIVVSPDDR